MPPSAISRPPHHTGACSSASTVSGGCDHSARPLAKIRMPYTRNNTPTKNQTGMISLFSLMSSPENNLQYNQKRHHDAAPEDWPVQQSNAFLVGYFRQAVDQAFQLRIRPRLCYQRDQQGNHHARDTRPKRLIHILRQSFRVRRKREQSYPSLARFSVHQQEHGDRRSRTGQQSPESRGPG